jgi:pimeloyl-ACP methyl ester carboxylesterase
MNSLRNTPELRKLTTPEGSVAYDIAGDGPLIVCVPGMGDLRGTYRLLAPQLRDAGYRVAVMDLRGHGDSDTTFASYGDEATAADITALITELGGPALIVGNSMAAGSAVLVAAAHPELVSGLVLIGAFVRNPKANAAKMLIFRAAMMPLWAATSWKSYLPKLYAGAKPSDFSEYRAEVIAAIKRPGHAKAFSLTTHTSHAGAERALPGVTAPALVLMGELDPDFSDPKAEAAWIGTALSAQVIMVPESGHYPQSQQPALVTSATVEFANKVTNRA